MGIDTRGAGRGCCCGGRVRLARSQARRWWGLVFVALGGLVALHVLRIIDLGSTVGRWWPVAIIGWGLVELLTARHFAPIAAIVTVVGVALLADEQRWPGRGLIWSAVFVGIGATILLRPRRRRRNGRRTRSANPDPTEDAASITPREVAQHRR